MYKSNIVIIFISQIFFLFQDIQSGDHEKLLYDRLTHGYNKLARPTQNESEPINVSLGISFQQILDIDEKSQFMTSNLWFKMTWKDVYLTWDPSEYAGIMELRLPINMLWRPDLMLYNNVDHNLDPLWPVNAVVKHDGNVTWIPPAIIKSSCRIEIRWFPFDQQNCTVKMGSWTYSGYFTELINTTISLDTYTPNGEWHLINIYSQRNVFRYDCCDEPYYDITFYVIIRRRTLYYSFNLVLPSFLISILALLSFTLPPDSGEKLNLCVTIFMSLCVFMLMVAETMPQTSDALPLIAIYFTCIMFEVGASVIFTVFALNYHHRMPETHLPMNSFLQLILLKWLPKFLCMKRPNSITISIPSSVKIFTESKKRKKIKKKSKKLNNFLFFNENENNHFEHSFYINPFDFVKNNDISMCHLQDCIINNENNKNNCPNKDIKIDYIFKENMSNSCIVPSENSSREKLINCTYYQLDKKNNEMKSDKQTLEEAIEKLAKINKEHYSTLMDHLSVITSKIQKEETMLEMRSDWVFAAMVIDRICFIFFSIFMLVCTGVIVFQAPHLFT